MPVVRLMKPSVQDNSDVKSTVKLMPTVKCQLTEVQVVASSRVQTVHHLPSPIRLRRFTRLPPHTRTVSARWGKRSPRRRACGLLTDPLVDYRAVLGWYLPQSFQRELILLLGLRRFLWHYLGEIHKLQGITNGRNRKKKKSNQVHERERPLL